MQRFTHRNVLLLIVLICSALSSSVYSAANSIRADTLIFQDAAVHPLEKAALLMHLSNSHNRLELISVKTADQLTLHGIKMLNPKATANVVFYSGNGLTIARIAGYLASYAQLPINMVWFDYRGTGASEKSTDINMPMLQQDALLVFDSAWQQLPHKLPTIVNGMSMGSLIAPYVATQRPAVAGIVLDSAIEDMPQLIMNMMHITDPNQLKLPPKIQAVDNKPVLAKLKQPLLLLEGEQDRLTPPSMAKSLFNASAAGHKDLEIIPGVGHAQPMATPQGIKGFAQFIAHL